MNHLFFKALEDGNPEAIKRISKIAALAVRNELEDFHSKHISDEDMTELNRLVRQGIYNTLFAFARYYLDPAFKRYIDWHDASVPSYWEDPELPESFKGVAGEFEQPLKASFNSKFLAGQYKIGNIFSNPQTRCIEIVGSYDFKEVPGNRHSHRNKISAQLRKEGYHYFDAYGGYVKNHWKDDKL